MCKKINNRKTSNTRIDKCMKKFIKNLNRMFDKDMNVEIIACCCGHQKYPASIIIRSDDGQGIDIVSDTLIPRKRNFYKRDKDGYYFIPELIETEARIGRIEEEHNWGRRK